MSVSEAPPLPQLAGRVEETPNMAPNEDDDEEQTSDNEEMPYIKCEAVYGGDGEEDDDDMSALPFVSTEMREDEVDDDDDEENMKFGMKAPEVGAYVKCSVPSCHSYFEVGNPKYEGFSHFKFPKDPDMRSRWIGIIGQKSDWNPDGAMICSNHFTESAFVTHLEHVAETGQLMPKRTLKPGAMPTMNLDLPGSWGRQRVVMPPNNGVPAAPVVPAVQRPVVHAATPPSIRSPYCQARTVNLTKNGKRRGRPPKNRPPDDYNSSISQLLNSQMPRIDPPSSVAAPTSSASQTNGVAQAMMAQSSAVSVVPSNTYGMPRPLPPFQLLDMGKRKRGRPRKEETLRRIADGVAADFGWRGGWRRNIPVKRRRILPTPESFQEQLQQLPQDRQRRVEQLECSIDPSNFLMNQEADNDESKNTDREQNLSYFKSLASNITDLRSSSLRELRCAVETTLVMLRKADAAAKAKKEAMERLKRLEEEAARRIEAPKKGTEAKEKQVGVDMKLPPSLSIKPVMKGSNHSSSFMDEEPTPALTITIKREKPSAAVNGKATSPKEAPKIKTEVMDEVKTEEEETKIQIKQEVIIEDLVENPENSGDPETEDDEKGDGEEQEEDETEGEAGETPTDADAPKDETKSESTEQSDDGDDVDAPKDETKSDSTQESDGDDQPEEVGEQGKANGNGGGGSDEGEDSSGTEDSDDEDSESQEDDGASPV